MTQADHTLVNGLAKEIPSRWRVRWASTVTQWNDRFGVCAGNGGRSGHVELVVEVELSHRGRIVVSSWLELSGERRTVLPAQEVDGEVSIDQKLCHVDLRLGEGEHLAVTIDAADHRLYYAQGSLLARAGFVPGAFDPPRLEVDPASSPDH
ncbi:MAG: hypothetical protein ACYTGC_07375 [Planctomycetota bacterium]|jgi:hypothetical protein